VTCTPAEPPPFLPSSPQLRSLVDQVGLVLDQRPSLARSHLDELLQHVRKLLAAAEQAREWAAPRQQLLMGSVTSRLTHDRPIGMLPPDAQESW
jgi:hypothetical protein